MAKVELKNLTKIYGKKTVVDHINLTVAEGTLTSILGPSGCGKSTTLRMIAGFEEPQDGDIFFDDLSVKNTPVNKREIGMVFQSYALFPHMTVYDNVAYGLQQRGIKGQELKNKVMDALKMVHMEEYAKRKPKQLSGGQQQRVALARALVITPKVLLLDECLSALDKKLRVEMQVELRKILESCQVTTFFVTHDQEEAMTLSDSIVVMNEGVIEQTGSPYEVYEHPKNKFVAGFLGKANFFDGEIGHFEDQKATIDTEEGRFVIPVQNVKMNSRMSLAIRPEKIELKEASGEDADGLIGHITSLTYSGNVTTYGVLCQRKEIIVEERSRTLNQGFKKGDWVSLSWSPDAMIILDDSEERLG